MASKISNSQVADKGSSIISSSNKTNVLSNPQVANYESSINDSNNKTSIIANSQVANDNSIIQDSNNETNILIKKIRTESIIISFIVGTLASLLASYVYEHWLK
jgi:predicted PurR-regulated permease PerM